MLGKKKGIAATTIVAILGIAGVGIASIFAISEMEGLLQFIVNNWIILFISTLGLGVVLIGVINSFQQNPKWKKDVGWFVSLLVVMFVVFFAWNSISTGYTADMTVELHNPYGNSYIVGVDVSNFQEGGIVVNMPFSILPEDDVRCDWTVRCDGEKVDDGSFTATLTEGYGQKKETQKLKNLPKDGNCQVDVELYEEGLKVDEKTKSFVVGEGESFWPW